MKGGRDRASVRPRLRVLFACVGNSARSQMAEAFARALGGPAVEARSGGSDPLGIVLPEAVAVMRERGIDISAAESKEFDEVWIKRECELVVTMGCEDDACPAFAGKQMQDWDLPDPKAKGIAEFRRVRDEIEGRVRYLLRTNGVTVAAALGGTSGGANGGALGGPGPLR